MQYRYMIINNMIVVKVVLIINNNNMDLNAFRHIIIIVKLSNKI